MFQETQPLAMEWFGGLNSETPPNDLPPFAAVTARDCVFPESGVATRPGSSLLVTGSFVDVNSLVVVSTRDGSVVRRQLLIASRHGPVGSYRIDVPSIGSLHGFKFPADRIMLATQYYQRALVTQTGKDGYGDYGVLLGTGGFGRIRFSPPAAPTVTPVAAGSGACTAGTHLFALSCGFDDGTEGPLGVATPGTVVATGSAQVTWNAGTLPTSAHVTSISVWATPIGTTTEFRRFLRVPSTVALAVFTMADSELQFEELVNAEPRLRSPRSPALAVEYAGRLAYFGERHVAVGGWDSGGSQGTDFGQGPGLSMLAAVTPGGWELVSGTGVGMRAGVAAIVFDGVSATPAFLRNRGNVFNDLPGIAKGAGGAWTGTFGVRITYSKEAFATVGGLRYGVSGTTGTTWAVIDLATLAADTIYVSELTVTGSFSYDLKLAFEGVGPGILNGEAYVWSLEAFDPSNTSHKSTVWWSEPLQTRSIDILNGGQTFGTADSGTAWTGFEWQGRFYVAKDSSLWVTARSSGPPSEWPVEKVSEIVGACGRRAIVHGPDFKVLVNRAGCWLFQGSAPGPDSNLATEIPVEWGAINWNEAWQVWGDIDPIQKRIYLGVPTGSSTYCNARYVLDYSGGFGPAGPSSGRRWSVWTGEARGGVVDYRKDAKTPELWVSKTADASTSHVVWEDPSQSVEYPAAPLEWRYETGRIGPEDASLALFRRLAFAAVGSGLLLSEIVKSDGVLVSLPAMTLYTPSRGTQTIHCNVKDERVGLRFSTVGAAAKAHLHRAALWMRRNPFGPHRMVNP